MAVPRVYLDACSLQRPFDDRSQPRVNVEAEAVLTILSLVELGSLELLSSEAVEYEIGRMPDAERLKSAKAMLRLARRTLEVTDEIEAAADLLVQRKFRPLDALHLAFADWTKADFLCTCDDKFLKKARRLTGLAVKVVSPLELIAEVAP
jgi:predicted nucleic acid-binding protein